MSSTERLIDHSLYPRTALADARHAYRDYCTVSISPIDGEHTRVLIAVKPTSAHQVREVVLGFLNYLLDCSAEIHLDSD